MRSFFLALAVLSLSALTSHAQPDSIDVESASFKDYYKRNDPTLKYVFNRYSYIHDYSGNWDFDGDGRPDILLFIPNGGAHVYWHPVIVLSSDNKVRDFSWLDIDMPVARNISELSKPGGDTAYLPQFVVGDFDGDGINEIYICLDHSGWDIPAKWKKRGVNSRHLLLKYEKGDIVVWNFNQNAGKARLKH